MSARKLSSAYEEMYLEIDQDQADSGELYMVPYDEDQPTSPNGQGESDDLYLAPYEDQPTSPIGINGQEESDELYLAPYDEEAMSPMVPNGQGESDELYLAPYEDQATSPASPIDQVESDEMYLAPYEDQPTSPASPIDQGESDEMYLAPYDEEPTSPMVSIGRRPSLVPNGAMGDDPELYLAPYEEDVTPPPVPRGPKAPYEHVVRAPPLPFRPGGGTEQDDKLDAYRKFKFSLKGSNKTAPNKTTPNKTASNKTTPIKTVLNKMAPNKPAPNKPAPNKMASRPLPPPVKARNANHMGFGSELQSKTAHDAILRLNDQELRLMDTLKRVIQHRVRADKEYAMALQGIGNIATRFDTDAQLSHNQSPLLKAWNHLIEETDRICKLIRSNAEEVQTIVEKLSLLIKDKHDSKRQYMQERTRIDSEFMKARREVDENLSSYKRCAREARENKVKYEEQLQKGNKVKDIDRAKEKYKKSVVKLHKAHNDYVLSLKAAGLHQEHYRNHILPRLLECLQQTQESQVAQMKQVLVEHCNLINSAAGKFPAHYSSIMQNMVEIRPEKEYISFVENYRMEPPAMETFTFDSSPSEEFPDNLKENTIVLDTLTIEAIQHSHSSLDEQLKTTRERLGEKKQELKSLDEEIRAIPTSPKEEGAILDLLSKQKAYRDVSREIQELRCQEAKLAIQYSMLDAQLSDMVDEDQLPPGITFPEGGGTGGTIRNTLQPANFNSSTDSTTPETKSSRSKMAKQMTKIFKGVRSNHDSSHEPQSQPTELPLEEEEFYHGALPRKETEALLVNDGDFLVREKSDAWGRYVLSAKHASKVRHFPIQINDEEMYRLEGDAFPTVGELIRFQLNSRQPVTKASQAILLRSVCRVRNEHDLRHEEIDLEEKLGAGHFGDVHRGRLKKTQMAVAVKTCKETVDAATRRKFLQEANILKQYDHVNIVKLIGVCTDKHPIYIVMELVPGGDLLSFLRNDQNELSTKQRVKMGEDAAAGMAYLESKQCIHRDLAARNCLVGNKNLIKISDFGMSREDDVYTIREGAMRQIPIKWTAPEAMNYGKYTSMSDVWSFGILLWEIFSNGSTPYPGMSNNEAREKVGQGYRMPPPDHTPDEVRILMDNCWKMDDEDRPKFKDAQAILKRAYRTVR